MRGRTFSSEEEVRKYYLVKKLLRKKHITQEQIAKIAGVSQPTVSVWKFKKPMSVTRWEKSRKFRERYNY